MTASAGPAGVEAISGTVPQTTADPGFLELSATSTSPRNWTLRSPHGSCSQPGFALLAVSATVAWRHRLRPLAMLGVIGVVALLAAVAAAASIPRTIFPGWSRRITCGCGRPESF